MERIIDFVLRQRLFVIIGVILLIGIGVYSFKNLTVDAFPDVTNIQVQVISKSPGMSPLETERFVTLPIELQMSGLPGLTETRSLSKFGLSLVTLVFEDNVDIYFARQLALERLITYLAPRWLGIPSIYFAVAVAFIFVLIVFI